MVRHSTAATALAALLILSGCELPTTAMNARKSNGADRVTADSTEPVPDWTPAPPFGWAVFNYEFFPDSIESTFDSLSTTHDTVTWRYRNYPRYTAYGEGWEIPVWTDWNAIYALEARIEYYMEKVGRLGAGILNQVPEYGIAILNRVPGLFSLCDPLGATVYDVEDGINPLVVILVYDRFERESFLCGDARRESVTGVMLHEFGHVIVDPRSKCTARWQDAVKRDRSMFPSQYSMYGVWGHDPRDSLDAKYWDCHDHPPNGALEADTIPTGEDIAESFSFWWLTRCKSGREPAMDNLVAEWFPGRLAILDSLLVTDTTVLASDSVTSCEFPVQPETAAADRFDLLNLKRDTIPDGVIIR